MNFILFLIFILIFIETIFYSVYEIKQNDNISGGVSVIVLAIISLVVPIISILKL